MNYIIKHWRGDFSLVISYWVNNVLVNFIILIIVIAAYFTFILITTFIYTQEINLHPQTLFKIVFIMFFISSLFFHLVLFPWQVIGTWRSSNKYYEKTGNWFWPIVVKVLIIIGIVTNIGELGREIPSYKHYFRLGFMKDRLADYKIALKKNGEVLHITGMLGFGIYEDVNKYFKNNNNITGIILDSGGGRLFEARKLSSLVMDKGLNAYTLNGCYSACAIIFYFW